LTDHTSYVSSLTLLNDGTLVSGSGDNTIHLWNIKTGESFKNLTGHKRNEKKFHYLL